MPRTIRWHEHVNSSYPMVHSAAEELLYEARKQGTVFTVPEEIEIANDKRRQKQHLPQQEHPVTGYSVADAAEEYGWSGWEATDAAKEMADPDVPQERKEALLKGTQLASLPHLQTWTVGKSITGTFRSYLLTHIGSTETGMGLGAKGKPIRLPPKRE